MRRDCALATWILAQVLSGCGGADATPDGSTPDAGDAGDTDGGAMAVQPPVAPRLPSFECPAGWRTVATGDGFDVCEPFPDGGRASCALHEGHFPGGAGCERIGTACPAGDFPEGLAATGVLYVSPGATGGDGTLGAPFGTIAEATAAATAGDTIALAKGTYSENVVMPEGVHLLGACVEETLLTSDAASYSAGVVHVESSGVVVQNLRIGQSARPGMSVIGDGASAVIRDVVFHECAVGGFTAEQGGSIEAENVGVHDMMPVASLNALGRAVNVEYGATATVHRLYAEGNAEHAVLVQHDADLTVEDATIVDTRLPSPTGLAGSGLTAAEGARLIARRVVIEEATMVGLLTQNEGTEAMLQDVVVRRTRPGVIFGGARGLEVNEGPTVSCSRCLFEDLLEFGVSSQGASVLTLTDAVIRNVDARMEDMRAGRGVSVQSGGHVTVASVAVLDAREVGVFAEADGSVVDGGDLVIHRIAPDLATGSFGRGLSAQSGAGMELNRVEVVETHEGGVVAVEPGSYLHLSDLMVRDVRPRPSDQRFGRGVIAQVEAEISLERGRVEQTREFGVGSIHDAVVTLTDVSVSDVRPQECAPSTCGDQPGGHGFGSYFGAELVAASFDISAAALCGVQVAELGTMNLQRGRISGSSIGACLQSTNQDVGALEDGVIYVDNGSNLETTTLPVPRPWAPSSRCSADEELAALFDGALPGRSCLHARGVGADVRKVSAEAATHERRMDRVAHHHVRTAQLAGEPFAAFERLLDEVHVPADLGVGVRAVDLVCDGLAEERNRLPQPARDQLHQQGRHHRALGEVQKEPVRQVVGGVLGGSEAAFAEGVEDVLHQGAGLGDHLAFVGDDRRLAQRMDLLELRAARGRPWSSRSARCRSPRPALRGARARAASENARGDGG